MVTEEELARAELLAELAGEEAAKVDPAQYEQYGPVIADRAQRVRSTHVAAVERVAQLRAARTAEQAHEAAELAATVLLDRVASDLAASSALVGGAVRTVGEALGALADVVAAHDRLVWQASGELAGVGLHLPDGLDWATGAGAAGAVRVRGRWWLPVDPLAVLAWTLRRVLIERYGRHDPVVRACDQLRGVAGLDRRADGLLAGGGSDGQ